MMMTKTNKSMTAQMEELAVGARAVRDEERVKLSQLFGSVTNASRAKRLVTDLLGPLGRCWTRDGVVLVGEQPTNSKPIVYGQGKSYQEAMLDACKDLTVDEVKNLAGPTLRAIGSVDVRRPQPLTGVRR